MVRARFTVALLLLSSPAVWAQFGSADMMKLAASRIDTITKALKLSPEQVNAIKPLIESKYTAMGAVKEKALRGEPSDASKPVTDARNIRREAVESLKAIDSKYDKQITSFLSPDQAKSYKNLMKGWKSDLSLNMPKP
jgi:hypothetical protein